MLARGWAVLCVGVGLFLGGTALAAPAPPVPVNTLSLESGLSFQEAHTGATVPRGSIGVAAVAAGQLDAHMTLHAGGTLPTDHDKEIWLPLRLVNPAATAQSWVLQVAYPSLDEVTLFERRGQAWSESTAGDRIALSAWPRPGRFPSFELQAGPQESRTVYLRVRNVVPAPLPLRLMSHGPAESAELRAELGFGFVLGALSLLVAACMIQAGQFRDTTNFLYGTYASLLGLAFLSASGLGGLYLWGDWPEWNDASKSVLPVAAAGVSVWLVRNLCRIRTRARMLARATAAIGGFIVAIALVLVVLRGPRPELLTAGMLASAATVLFMGAWTWRRGDTMGAWVLASHAPLIFVTVLILLRIYGIVPIRFESGTLLALAIGAILVLLLAALAQRSRESRAVQERGKDMAALDPLTGLMAGPLWHGRVRAAVLRYNRSGHNAAVLYVRLANHARIREAHGAAVAEQSMIRAAMKLQRLMPDADCYGRVSESTMGLIVETVTQRDALMQRCTRLVAHGLMPLPGIEPDVVLHLQVVAVVLSDHPLAADRIHAELERALAAMSSRTRRPIRFLVPEAPDIAPEPAEPAADGRSSVAA